MNEVFNNYNEQFHDFDDPETYKEYMEKATSRFAANFVVRFGDKKARIATNLTDQDVDALIHQTAPGKGDKDLPVTWMYVRSLFLSTRLVSDMRGSAIFGPSIRMSMSSRSLPAATSSQPA